ncbi:MAG: amidohydrolase family protein, partial [Acidimicrobiales bacterium]|nr:amidohydrolase family protein [Acidimicrobiales bacterium]
GQVTHPRTAGTYSRALRLWRQAGLPLPDVIRRCTLLPARLLEACVPAMAQKGRVQPGADADLAIFDAARVTDQATYAESTRPSSGIVHVLVHGRFVVRDGELVPGDLPGQAVRARPTP